MDKGDSKKEQPNTENRHQHSHTGIDDAIHNKDTLQKQFVFPYFDFLFSFSLIFWTTFNLPHTRITCKSSH